MSASIVTFQDYLDLIADTEHQGKFAALVRFTEAMHAGLTVEIKWNTPMLTLGGTFIIAYSVAKTHIAVGPELVILEQFRARVSQAGYQSTKSQFTIPWDAQVNWSLLREMVEQTIMLKKGSKTFWYAG
ncbi:iron chaperone [Auritidibacter sp. NML100628]|nr:iron chaperone [Auritidibacter sp. NML100628]